MTALTTDALVEAMARAIHEARYVGCATPWASLRSHHRRPYLNDARAALAALVEAAGLKPDPDSGEWIAAKALEVNAFQFAELGAHHMESACLNAAALLRALAGAAEGGT